MTPFPPTWDPVNRRLRLSGSSLSRFQLCPRRGFLASILGLTKPLAAGPPAWFGGALPAGFATLLRGDALESAHAAVDTEYVGLELPPDEYRTPGLAHQVLDKLATQWREDNWTVLERDGEQLVEYPFHLPLGRVDGVEVSWSGIVDLGVSWSNRQSIVDHKFTSRAPDYDTAKARYELSAAQLGYLWALEKLGWGDFDSAVINTVVVRPPVARETAKTKPRIELGPSHRLVIPYSSERKARWVGEVLRLAGWIVKMIDEWERLPDIHSPFPRFDTGCSAWNRVCEYHPACSMHTEEDYLDVLESPDYTTTTTNDEKEPNEQV